MVDNYSFHLVDLGFTVHGLVFNIGICANTVSWDGSVKEGVWKKDNAKSDWAGGALVSMGLGFFAADAAGTGINLDAVLIVLLGWHCVSLKHNLQNLSLP